MKKTLITLTFIVFAFSANALAQRSAVSGSEVTGTFTLTSDSNRTSQFKIVALGKGDLKVEFSTALNLGSDGNPRGNTGTGSGKATISGNIAIFAPDGQESDQCSMTIVFVKLGQIKVAQDGDCGFINDMISTEGIYKRTSAVKPKFIN